jgi:hypothetical protein
LWPAARRKKIAQKVGKLLESRGFNVYVAIDVQTIFEINTGIIRELKDSDYDLFVNFCREKMDAGLRGSLFSNQELAIAYALGYRTSEDFRMQMRGASEADLHSAALQFFAGTSQKVTTALVREGTQMPSLPHTLPGLENQ